MLLALAGLRVIEARPTEFYVCFVCMQSDTQ